MISEPPSNWNFTLGSQSLSASKAFTAAAGVFFHWKWIPFRMILYQILGHCVTILFFWKIVGVSKFNSNQYLRNKEQDLNEKLKAIFTEKKDIFLAH